MRAIVTGGAGFIGSNLVDGLQAAGHDAAVLDNLSTGRRKNLSDAVRLHECDVVDGDAVRRVFERERPEVVFHLAAQVDVRRSVEDPASDARVNVEGTVNVMRAALLAGTRRVVFSSTGGAIYGEADEVPTDEDAPLRPLAPYGAAKYAAEGYLRLFASLHGISTIALRYANVYGPRQDPLGEGGVVAIFCGACATGATATIYGSGEQTRDYVFVEDVVRANLLAAGSSATGAVNVGSGIQTSVLELFAQLEALGNGHRPRARHAPAREGEVIRSCLDASRARETLGWETQVPLADGLARTLAHVARSSVRAPADQRT